MYIIQNQGNYSQEDNLFLFSEKNVNKEIWIKIG